jgi:hypothetical protein
MNRRKFLRSLLLSAVVTSCLSDLRAATESRAVTENRLKAAYLLKFSQYVTWPPESFADASAPLRIALPSGSALLPELAQEVSGLRGSRPVQVVSVATPAEAADCHVLYVGSGEVGDPAAWLGAFRNRPLLVVSDLPEAIETGATIKMLQEARALRFEVNQSAADDSRLALNAEMLRYAKVIHKRREGSLQ